MFTIIISIIMALTKINGAIYNTRALQQANYGNIQVKDNALWGEVKAKPVVKPAERKIVMPVIKPVNKSIPAKPTPLFVEEKKPLPATPQPTTFAETALAKNEPYFNKSLTGTGIQLQNVSNPDHQRIADKYSPFFKSPIQIEIINDDKQFADPSFHGKSISGANNYYNDGSRRIQVMNTKDLDSFEIVLLHEIAHNVYHYDEDSAWDYAKRMMDVANSIK